MTGDSDKRARLMHLLTQTNPFTHLSPPPQKLPMPSDAAARKFCANYLRQRNW